jgi:inner membrane protein
MPSPIGHSLAGYAVYAALRPSGAQSLKLIGLCLFAANAADLDFVPGILIGDPERFHHGMSHSIVFAALFALACGSLRLIGPSFGTNVAAFFTLYCSHVALDYLSIDTSAPYGVPLFWPLANDYYIAPFAFLPDIRRSPAASEFFVSLFTLHNLWAVTVESIIFAPILLIIRVVKKPSRVVELSFPQPPPTHLIEP